MTYVERIVDDRPTSAVELLVLIGSSRPAWHGRAACTGQGDVMFPTSVQGVALDYRPALALCRSCEVEALCRRTSADERHGVWGGVVRERRAVADAVAALVDLGGWWTASQIAARLDVAVGRVRRRLSQLEREGVVDVRPGRPPTPTHYRKHQRKEAS